MHPSRIWTKFTAFEKVYDKCEYDFGIILQGKKWKYKLIITKLFSKEQKYRSMRTLA